MNEKTCESCEHYIPHYVRIGRKFHKIDFGHCVYPRIKNRDKATKACEHYTPKK